MSNEKHGSSSLALMAFGALGVVFGDIGTSPLYALKECLRPFKTVAEAHHAVFGICSLILWSLALIISVKYVIFVMRADNGGEGGILALTSYARGVSPCKVKSALALLGLFGAAAFYSDGAITPAISVLSAVEGMELVKPDFAHYAIFMAFSVLLGLFYIQKKGTAAVGFLFGPVMACWFAVLGASGIYRIVQHPEILKAVSPLYAISLLSSNPGIGMAVVGAVFLTLTGGEALYADMGHFGRKPISAAWFAVVFPGLILNYFGQGALTLESAKLLKNPFYEMLPHWSLIPMIGLATLATIIASQAVISGAFSMTNQAIRLGYLPRLTISHTSDEEIGQIYAPFVNWILFFVVSMLLFVFKSSDALTSAYGIAVATTMLITTTLLGFVIWYKWKWGVAKFVAFMSAFVVIDAFFLSSNALKIADGGWVTLALTGLIFFVMTTWKKGSALARISLQQSSMSIKEFMELLAKSPELAKVPGTAVYFNRMSGRTPVSLMHNLKHNKVLHETLIFLNVEVKGVPRVAESERFSLEKVANGAYQVVLRLGFKETPDVPKVLEKISELNLIEGWKYSEGEVSFFFTRTSVKANPHTGMAVWRENFFDWMSRSSIKASDYFNVPHNRVVELGSQICL